MTNTPPTNLMSDAANQGEESCREPHELVDEVLRDARSLLGEDDPESTHAMPLQTQEAVRSTVRLEPGAAEGLFTESDTPDGIKHAASAIDLGEHGPTVDLFGTAEPSISDAQSELPSVSVSGPSLAAVEAAVEKSPPMSPAALALDALLAERVAQESEDDRGDGGVAAVLPKTTPNTIQRRAAEAERAAVDVIDVFGSSQPRSTAGEIETVVDSQPPRTNIPSATAPTAAVRFETIRPPEDSSEPAVDSKVTSVAAISDSVSEPTSDQRPEPVVTVGPIRDHAAMPALAPEVKETQVRSLQSEGSVAVKAVSPSLVFRIGAMPFSLVPSSLHRLVTITALSLAVWVPVVWAYAVFGPEFFSGAVSATGADVREPLEPTGIVSPPLDQAEVATVTDRVDP